jgi:signal transduction histidine kinase
MGRSGGLAVRDRNIRSDQGRVERATVRLYERLGSKVVIACVIGGTAIGVITYAVVVAVAFRYLRLSFAHALSFFELWTPIILALLLVGLWSFRREIRTALSWPPDAEPGDKRAIQGWYIGVRIPEIGARVALIAGMSIVPAAVYMLLHFHRPWYDIFALVTGGVAGLSGVWVLIVFATELVTTPMLRDVAAKLPAGFEPRMRGLSLRARALAPLPIVTFFAAMIVGAWANISSNPDVRVTFAVGVCFATVAIATVIFLIVNRSVLAPIDDLLAATERVQKGDITTPVPLTSADELGQLAMSFNEMLADLRRSTEELRASRERIVAASDASRRKVERDLHDGAQQQLVLARLKLARLARDPSRQELVGELERDLDRALGELRDLAHGLYPQVLESDGLPGALGEAARNAAIPTTFDCDGAGRYRPQLEAAVYFCCLEALQNAAKHAGEGARATVKLVERDRRLEFEVSDDGVGFEQAPPGHGLQNIADRIGALGGKLRIASTPGHGTTIAGLVPVEEA